MPSCDLNSLDLNKCSPLKLVFREHSTPKCYPLSGVVALMPSLMYTVHSLQITSADVVLPITLGFLPPFWLSHWKLQPERFNSSLENLQCIISIGLSYYKLTSLCFHLSKLTAFLIKNPNQLFQNFSSLHSKPRETTIINKDNLQIHKDYFYLVIKLCFLLTFNSTFHLQPCKAVS